MTQMSVQSPSVDKLPDNSYYVQTEKKKEDFYKNESHIHKQNLFSGAKAELHKLSNDIFTYFPKGFSGSKNSDFYEFLSMGKLPNIIGSAMLIGLYSFANNKFNAKDANSAGKVAKSFGAGVVLYGVGKWLSKKISHTAIKNSTGVNLDQYYIDKKIELPEQGQDKGLTRIEYRQVLESTEFPRVDLLNKKGEIESGNQHAEYEKIAEKNGWGKNLNAVGQIVIPKMRELKTRTTAMENISGYVAAATGVALGGQEAFQNIKLGRNQNIVKNVNTTIHSIATALKDSTIELWKGTNKNPITKNFGKALLLGSAATTLATWLFPTKKFKEMPTTMQSKVDTNKEFEVC